MKRLITCVLTIWFLLSLLAGCANTDDGTATDTATDTPTDAVSDLPSAGTDAIPSVESEIEFPGADESQIEISNIYSLPLAEEVQTLTFMRGAPAFMGAVSVLAKDDFNDFEYMKYLESITNVHIEFDLLSFFSLDELMSIAISSGDFADLLGSLNYSGGLLSALNDDIIIDLTDKLAEYSPNYNTIINSDESLKTLAQTEGKALSYMSPYDNFRQNQGLVIREDWLNELGLSAPETYDEMYDTLLAFKNAYDSDATIYMNSECYIETLAEGYNIAAFGAGGSDPIIEYFSDNSTVKCTLIEDDYKEYLMMLNQWYNDGLFNEDFMSIQYDPFSGYLDGKIYDGQMGVWNTSTEGIDNYANNNVSVVPVPALVRNKGDMQHVTEMSLLIDSQINTVITSNCENVELAMRWIDYWYSADGILFSNYGLENVTYTLEDGTPAFTDLVVKNDLGVNISSYMRGFSGYSFFDSVLLRYRTAEYSSDLANSAWEVWTSKLDGTMTVPSSLTYTAEEAEIYGRLSADLYTLASEKIAQFVSGNIGFDQWDSFVATLKSQGIEDCIAIVQAAYDRLAG